MPKILYNRPKNKCRGLYRGTKNTQDSIEEQITHNKAFNIKLSQDFYKRPKSLKAYIGPEIIYLMSNTTQTR